MKEFNKNSALKTLDSIYFDFCGIHNTYICGAAQQEMRFDIWQSSS